MTSKLSPQQLEQFKQAFKMLDIDGDGKIEPNELRSIMKQFGFSTNQEDIKAIIKNIDQDNSGTIELDEFLNFIANQATETKDELIDMLRVFKLFDKDGNGLITKEQLRLGLKQLGENMTDKDVSQLMQAADLDGDGKISYDEFVQLMRMK